MAVKVFEGNTGDPLREGFGLPEVVVLDDRGTITSARIRQDLPASSGIQWITALRASQVQKLATAGHLQMSLFDQTDLVESAHPDYAGERLIACFNPLLAEERARKRPELLAATEKQLKKNCRGYLAPKAPTARQTAYRRASGQDSQPLQNRRRQFSYQRLAGRVRAHILLCMRQRLAAILFDEDDKCQVQAARKSMVAPAQRSPSSELKALPSTSARSHSAAAARQPARPPISPLPQYRSWLHQAHQRQHGLLSLRLLLTFSGHRLALSIIRRRPRGRTKRALF